MDWLQFTLLTGAARPDSREPEPLGSSRAEQSIRTHLASRAVLLALRWRDAEKCIDKVEYLRVWHLQRDRMVDSAQTMDVDKAPDK